MYVPIKKRFMAYVLCLSFLIGATAYKPQQTEAVALTSTAAVVALVASVMTACGVTYWASTQQDAIDYLGGKIETYLGTLSETYSSALEWLGINSISDAFTVMNGGLLRVPASIANKILDFISWFNTEEGVQSGGNSVGVLGTTNYEFMKTYPGTNQYGTFGVSALGNSQLQITAYGVYAASNWRATSLYILLPLSGIEPSNITVSIYDITGTLGVNQISLGLVKENQYQWNGGGTSFSVGSSVNGSNPAFTVLGYDHIAIQLSGRVSANASSPNEGNVVLELTGIGAKTSDSVLVTPSETVVVPPALEEDQSFVVTTTASIQQGDTQEEACQAILDTVVSQDGLSSTSTTEGSGAPTAWSWLSNILTDIKGLLNDIWLEISSLPTAIGNTIGTANQNAISGISTTVTNIYTFLQNTITGIGQKVDDVKGAILGLPSSIASAISGVLSAAFVPSQAYINTFVASLNSTFDNRFSILSYPFSLLGTFITKCATVGNADPILTWGNIYEPFSNKLLLPAGSYNLNTALQNQTISYAHSLYMIVVKGIISFQFVSFLYAWFCDVFHMKNDDFANPLDSGDDETDVDDGDGYDGFYSSY